MLLSPIELVAAIVFAILPSGRVVSVVFRRGRAVGGGAFVWRASVLCGCVVRVLCGGVARSSRKCADLVVVLVVLRVVWRVYVVDVVV